MQMTKNVSRSIAAGLAATFILLTAGCGQQASQTAGPTMSAPQTAPPPTAAPAQGMSTRKKVVLLAGAALLYYLYKKHQATQAANVASGAQPQLYRSRNGGIYYRDAQHNPVWLTVPQQGIQVPADDVQRYAPDYGNYQGNAPAAPSGYRTQSFSEFDPSAQAG